MCSPPTIGPADLDVIAEFQRKTSNACTGVLQGMDAPGYEQYPIFDTVKSSPNFLLYTLLPPVDYKSHGKALRETQIAAILFFCIAAVHLNYHFLILSEALITVNVFVEKYFELHFLYDKCNTNIIFI